jgi:hypothetical protein
MSNDTTSNHRLVTPAQKAKRWQKQRHERTEGHRKRARFEKLKQARAKAPVAKEEERDTPIALAPVAKEEERGTPIALYKVAAPQTAPSDSRLNQETLTPTQRHQAKLEFARFATEMHVKASTELTAVHEKTCDSVTSLGKTLATLGKTVTQAVMEHFDKGVDILHDVLIVRDDET